MYCTGPYSPIDPIGPTGPRGTPGPQGPVRRSTHVQEHAAVPLNNEVKLMDDDSVPNPFDFDGHLSAITRNRNKRGTSSKKRYVLFILDSSGSITKPQFAMMKQALSSLLPLFCDNAIFGVMSVGAKLERNICFDCNQKDRIKLQQALLSIKYHNGPYTRSGDAIRCACDYMLSKKCGYYDDPNSITDVIFLTGGGSNRGENVCTAVNCFPEGVNVVSIAVGPEYNINYKELACIVGNNGGIPHIFDVHNLNGLRRLQSLVENYIVMNQKVCKSTFDPL